MKRLLGLLCIVGLLAGSPVADAHTGPQLGAPIAAFIRAWGTPITQPSGDDAWDRCPHHTLYQREVSVIEGRVLDITWRHCDTRPFTAAQMRTALVPMLPPDVAYRPAVSRGTTYHSAVLKAIGIRAALYVDCAFSPVPRGTLWIGTGSRHDWFSVLVGEGCPNG